MVRFRRRSVTLSNAC